MDTCCRTCSRTDNFQAISVDAISQNNGEPVYLMLIYCTQLQVSWTGSNYVALYRYAASFLRESGESPPEEKSNLYFVWLLF